MLREITHLRQSKSYHYKRWFTDPDMDLYVWFDHQVPVRFQLSYNKGSDEHAISWSSESGFSHNRVDSGEQSNCYKMTPIMLRDGEFDAHATARRFLRASELIDATLADFIYARLLEYPEHYVKPSGPDTVAKNV